MVHTNARRTRAAGNSTAEDGIVASGIRIAMAGLLAWWWERVKGTCNGQINESSCFKD